MHIQTEFISITEEKKPDSNSELRPLPANKNIFLSCSKVLTYTSKNLKDTKDCVYKKISK